MRDAGLMGAFVLIGAALVVVTLVASVVVLCVRRSWTRARAAAVGAGLV